MLTWTERLVVAYEPPEDWPPPPAPPASSWRATAPDGAELAAFVWGSPLGLPFVVEVRRYSVPELEEPDGHGGILTRAEQPPELPTLGELQSAADQLVPLGTLLLLTVFANGADATYPNASGFRAVRMMQAQMEVAPPLGGQQKGARS